MAKEQSSATTGDVHIIRAVRAEDMRPFRMLDDDHRNALHVGRFHIRASGGGCQPPQIATWRAHDLPKSPQRSPQIATWCAHVAIWNGCRGGPQAGHVLVQLVQRHSIHLGDGRNSTWRHQAPQRRDEFRPAE